jgi:saccharopine dehydrogenase-like NADP-dependent oxidoreductase
MTIASNILSEAEILVQKYHNYIHISATLLDIFDTEKLENLISKNDHVISFVPPNLHSPVC